jgi:hypothetical protein
MQEAAHRDAFVEHERDAVVRIGRGREASRELRGPQRLELRGPGRVLRRQVAQPPPARRHAHGRQPRHARLGRHHDGRVA